MTGSTTVDSNFLLAHKEQLDEVFQVYLDDINPFIVQFEILKSGLLNNNSYILCGLLPLLTKDETEQRLKEIDGAFYTESETVKIKVS